MQTQTMQTQTIRAGTRIEFFVSHPQGSNETARIGRWTRVNGPIKNHVAPNNGGWHVVQFETGGLLLVHETSFRVIDNRA